MEASSSPSKIKQRYINKAESSFPGPRISFI